MSATVFGNQAYMEVKFDDALLRTGIPALYRATLTELADTTGGTAIFMRGFADQPYIKGNLGGSSLNSLVKITGYNSKRLMQIADLTLAKVGTNRRVRNPRITGTERFGRSSTEETVVTLQARGPGRPRADGAGGGRLRAPAAGRGHALEHADRGETRNGSSSPSATPTRSSSRSSPSRPSRARPASASGSPT